MILKYFDMQDLRISLRNMLKYISLNLLSLFQRSDIALTVDVIEIDVTKQFSMIYFYYIYMYFYNNPVIFFNTPTISKKQSNILHII